MQTPPPPPPNLDPQDVSAIVREAPPEIRRWFSDHRAAVADAAEIVHQVRDGVWEFDVDAKERAQERAQQEADITAELAAADSRLAAELSRPAPKRAGRSRSQPKRDN